MHPRTRLTLDLLKGFPRASHKPAKLMAYGAYLISRRMKSKTLERWRGRHPLHAYILLTTRCNMSCEDCYFVDVINDKKVGRLDFDLEQVEKNYENPLFHAVSRVVLYGGEPTLIKPFVDIIRFFRSRGVVTTMTSNVLRLNRKMLDDIR